MYVTFYRQSNGLFVIRVSERKGVKVEKYEYRYFNADDADERLTDLFLTMKNIFNVWKRNSSQS